jgi:hypothetical protein
MKTQFRAALAAFALAVLAAPVTALACACGCTVFDVGANSFIASGQRGAITLEYDFMDQTVNWSGSSHASHADNDDKRITTHFIKLDGEYMINEDWSVMVDLPVTNRTFHTLDDNGVSTDVFRDTAWGDIRLVADYTGLSKDMSTGLLFGVKLATGDIGANGFDRDTAIGTGSTDLIVGGYHRGEITRDGHWTYFVQGQGEIPVALSGGYRPGHEFDGAAGVFFNGLKVGDGHIVVQPVLQLLVSARAPDGGVLADRPNSGYQRVLLSPGVQISRGDWVVYGDVELPAYQHVNGNQLTAPVLFKFAVTRTF